MASSFSHSLGPIQGDSDNPQNLINPSSSNRFSWEVQPGYDSAHSSGLSFMKYGEQRSLLEIRPIALKEPKDLTAVREHLSPFAEEVNAFFHELNPDEVRQFAESGFHLQIEGQPSEEKNRFRFEAASITVSKEVLGHNWDCKEEKDLVNEAFAVARGESVEEEKLTAITEDLEKGCNPLEKTEKIKQRLSSQAQASFKKLAGYFQSPDYHIRRIMTRILNIAKTSLLEAEIDRSSPCFTPSPRRSRSSLATPSPLFVAESTRTPTPVGFQEQVAIPVGHETYTFLINTVLDRRGRASSHDLQMEADPGERQGFEDNNGLQEGIYELFFDHLFEGKLDQLRETNVGIRIPKIGRKIYFVSNNGTSNSSFYQPTSAASQCMHTDSFKESLNKIKNSFPPDCKEIRIMIETRKIL